MRERASLWSRDLDFSFLWRIPMRRPVETILGLGVFLRVLVYLQNRDYWMDEGTLLGNIDGKAVLEFSDYLAGDQLAPIGFLISERMLVSWLGSSGYVTRFIPLCAGLLSLWLFRSLAMRWLTFPAALVALTLFALSDDLVYYSSELKPYSVDLAVSLAVLAMGSRLVRRPMTRQSALPLGLLVVISPWISFPSAFLIAGVGTALLVHRLSRRSWIEAAWLALVAIAWLISFGISYRASHALLHPATTMYVFWNFAFLPFPQRSMEDGQKLAGVLLETLVNPLNLLPPFLPSWWVVLPGAFFFVGMISLARREPLFTMMLLGPMLLAMVAAAARRYPFHGRLMLGLVPAYMFFLAEGVDFAREKMGRKGFLAAAFLLLAYPCLATIYESQGSRFREFNSHGDLHRNRFVP